MAQDLLLDLGSDAIWVWVTRAALLLHEGANPSNLEGTADLVEGIAVVGHEFQQSIPETQVAAPAPPNLALFFGAGDAPTVGKNARSAHQGFRP